MKINCLSCGHKIDLDEVYDDYEGQIKCLTCGALLDIKTEGGGRLDSVSLSGSSSSRPQREKRRTPKISRKKSELPGERKAATQDSSFVQ